MIELPPAACEKFFTLLSPFLTFCGLYILPTSNPTIFTAKMDNIIVNARAANSKSQAALFLSFTSSQQTLPQVPLTARSRL
jgi:hypothetical protein